MERPRSASCSGKRPSLSSECVKHNNIAASNSSQKGSRRIPRQQSCSGGCHSPLFAAVKGNNINVSDSLQNCFTTKSYTKEAQKRWEEEEARRIRAQKVQKATEAIKTYILSAGDPAEVADKTSLLILQDEAALKVCPGSRVVPEILDEFRQRAYRELFELKLMAAIPFSMTDSQKHEIANIILGGQLHTEIFELLKSTYRTPESAARLNELLQEQCTNAVKSALHEKSAFFHCPICMDPFVSLADDGKLVTSNMWFPPLRKSTHWSNHPCGHAYCRSCMSKWTETAINDQRVRIKCPAEACPYSLYDQDVQELVSREVFERHKEHKNADYLKHLKESVQEDTALKAWLQTNARPCPACHVIVSRSEGCNHMTCVCGTRFCYQCGFQSCKCRAEEKSDIWNPEAN